MVYVNKAIISILILACIVNARAASIAESFSINAEGNPNLKLFLSNKVSLFIYDSNKDTIVDQIYVKSANASVQISKNWVQLSFYKKKMKLTTKLKKTEDGQYVIANILLKKLQSLYYSKRSSLIEDEGVTEINELSESDPNSLCVKEKENPFTDIINLKQLIDESTLSKIQFEKCTQPQISHIKNTLANLYQEHLKKRQDYNLASCLKEYTSNSTLPDNLLPLIILKLEEIANSTSDLNFKCIDLNSSDCKRLKLNRTEIYPSKIELCFKYSDQLGVSSTLLSEIMRHELLHSKDIELSEKEVKLVLACWSGLKSPLQSIESAHASASEKSASIADEVSFSPAQDIKVETKAVPIKLAEQQEFFNKQLAEGGVTGNVGLRIPDDSRIMNMGSSSIIFAQRVVDDLVPQALALESARNPRVAQLAKEFYSGDSGKLTSNLPSNELLNQYGFSANNSGGEARSPLTRATSKSLGEAAGIGTNSVSAVQRSQQGDSSLNTQGSNGNQSIASTRSLNNKEQASAEASSNNLDSTKVAQENQKPKNTGSRSTSSVQSPGDAVAHMKQIFPNQPNGNSGRSNVEATLNFLRNQPSVETVRLKMQNPSFANALKVNKISIYLMGTNGKPITNNNHQFEPQYYFVEKNGKLHETKGNDQTAFSNDY